MMTTKLCTVCLALLVAGAGIQTSVAQTSGFAVDANGDLYRIEPATGLDVLIGATGVTDLVEGLASDPSGNLYATTSTGNLLRLDLVTGTATLLGNHGAGTLEGLDYWNGRLIGIDFNRPGGLPQRLYELSLDSVTAISFQQIDRNDLLLISSLAIADEGTAYFQGVLTLGTGTLFALDLASGQTALIGHLSVPLTGLDFDGQTLIGLGFSGRVFAVDRSTAEMTLLSETSGQQAWLGLDLPEPTVSTLECAATGTGGDSFALRHIRFQTEFPFTGIGLRMEATAPGDYFFDVQLRRADDVTVMPERIVPGAAIGLSGDFSTTPYQPVAIDFGAVPVAGLETFTARIVNVTGPGGTLVFETFGAFEPCPGVEEMDTLSASVIGDPAGFKLLTDPNLDAPLLVCEMPGLMNGDLAGSRGVRFTTDRDFRAAELRFNGTAPGTYSFDMELRRSSGFTGPVERVVDGLGVDVPGGLNVQPFRPVNAPFGELVRVLGPETFTLKMINVSGPGALLFETYGIGNTPCPNVEETEENNVANPTVRGDPAGYRLLSVRDLPYVVVWCPSTGLVGYSTQFRGIQFTTGVPFTALELQMDGPLPGEYIFTAELRASSGFLAPPERIVRGIVANVPGNAASHPYESIVRIDFGPEALAPGTYTLKIVEMQGPESTMFFDVSGSECASGDVAATLQNNVATPEVLGSPAGFRLLLSPDSDGDGVNDFVDNCLFTPNDVQRDTDADGIGNFCDPDFSNDCIVNFVDLAFVKAVFFSSDPDADLNGDGRVNFGDLAIVKDYFFGGPGPASLPNLCP